MKRRFRKLFLIAVASIVASTVSTTPAQANDFGTSGWDTAFTMTLVSNVTNGANQEITFTGEHSLATVVASNAIQGPGELRPAAARVIFCEPGTVVSYVVGTTSTPSGCTFPSPQSTTITVASGVATVVVTVASNLLPAGMPIYPDIRWEDANMTTFQVAVGGSSSSAGSSETPTPAKYSGPEFSGLSGMGIMTGSTGKLEGKRLDQISSIEIGGKAATFTANSATELELSLPAGLAPGLYDLVINSSAGKLTHIKAIQVREPKKSFSITTRSTGKISNDQYIEHSLIASMQIPELNKARCIVNASTQAMAQAMANRLCAVVKASNPNIETTIVEPRSTVKGDAVYARVTYGWN